MPSINRRTLCLWYSSIAPLTEGEGYLRIKATRSNGTARQTKATTHQFNEVGAQQHERLSLFLPGRSQVNISMSFQRGSETTRKQYAQVDWRTLSRELRPDDDWEGGNAMVGIGKVNSPIVPCTKALFYEGRCSPGVRARTRATW